MRHDEQVDVSHTLAAQKTQDDQFAHDLGG
jgi:hypothetical protein